MVPAVGSGAITWGAGITPYKAIGGYDNGLGFGNPNPKRGLGKGIAGFGGIRPGPGGIPNHLDWGNLPGERATPAEKGHIGRQRKRSWAHEKDLP